MRTLSPTPCPPEEDEGKGKHSATTCTKLSCWIPVFVLNLWHQKCFHKILSSTKGTLALTLHLSKWHLAEIGWNSSQDQTAELGGLATSLDHSDIWQQIGLVYRNPRNKLWGIGSLYPIWNPKAANARISSSHNQAFVRVELENPYLQERPQPGDSVADHSIILTAGKRVFGRCCPLKSLYHLRLLALVTSYKGLTLSTNLFLFLNMDLETFQASSA